MRRAARGAALLVAFYALMAGCATGPPLPILSEPMAPTGRSEREQRDDRVECMDAAYQQAPVTDDMKVVRYPVPLIALPIDWAVNKVVQANLSDEEKARQSARAGRIGAWQRQWANAYLGCMAARGYAGTATR